MGAVTLIAQIFSGFVLLPTFTDQTSDLDDDDVDAPVAPVDPATLGASFANSGEGITIEVNENETGRLAVETFVDTLDSEGYFLTTHEALLFCTSGHRVARQYLRKRRPHSGARV